eukprot:486195-Prymnesium_polylepis.1
MASMTVVAPQRLPASTMANGCGSRATAKRNAVPMARHSSADCVLHTRSSNPTRGVVPDAVTSHRLPSSLSFKRSLGAHTFMPRSKAVVASESCSDRLLERATKVLAADARRGVVPDTNSHSEALNAPGPCLQVRNSSEGRPSIEVHRLWMLVQLPMRRCAVATDLQLKLAMNMLWQRRASVGRDDKARLARGRVQCHWLIHVVRSAPTIKGNRGGWWGGCFAAESAHLSAATRREVRGAPAVKDDQGRRRGRCFAAERAHGSAERALRVCAPRRVMPRCLRGFDHVTAS